MQVCTESILDNAPLEQDLPSLHQAQLFKQVDSELLGNAFDNRVFVDVPEFVSLDGKQVIGCQTRVEDPPVNDGNGRRDFRTEHGKAVGAGSVKQSNKLVIISLFDLNDESLSVKRASPDLH